jgi:pimeloyl-ACP methyl ester carboxylesterase
MGAGVALRIGVQHPQLVERLILVSTVMASAGWHPKVQRELAVTCFPKTGPRETGKFQLLKRYPSLDRFWPESSAS